MAVVSGGAVYRRGDDDSTHSPMFYQIEGFLVNEHVTFAELQGRALGVRRKALRPPHRRPCPPELLPFVEPGAEVDIECAFCTEMTRRRPAACAKAPWLEVLGAG